MNYRCPTHCDARHASYRYDAWGRALGEGSDGSGGLEGVWWQATTAGSWPISIDLAQTIATRQPLRYAGYYYDAESEMYYLSARHYDPETRLFLSKDPSRNDGEQSAYQYCLGNPVGNVDPTGYKPYTRGRMRACHDYFDDFYHWFQSNINIYSQEHWFYQMIAEDAYNGGTFSQITSVANPYYHLMVVEEGLAEEAQVAVEWYAEKSANAGNAVSAFLWGIPGSLAGTATHENIAVTESALMLGFGTGSMVRLGAGSSTLVATQAEKAAFRSLSELEELERLETALVGRETTAEYAYRYTYRELAAEYEQAKAIPARKYGIYCTPNGELTPLQAQIDLARPYNSALPDVLLRIDLEAMREAGYQIPRTTFIARCSCRCETDPLVPVSS